MLLLFLLSSCVTSQIHKDYKRASTMDTVSGYEEFIRKYPEGEYKEQEANRHQELYEINKQETLKANRFDLYMRNVKCLR